MALAGEIVVSTDQLIEKAGTVEKKLGDMKRHFSDLKDLIDGTANYWTGVAAQEHRDAYAKTISHIEQMFQRYEEHISDLRQMAGVYEAVSGQIEGAIDELTAPDFD